MQEWYHPVNRPQQMGRLRWIPQFFRKLTKKTSSLSFLFFSVYFFHCFTNFRVQQDGLLVDIPQSIISPLIHPSGLFKRLAPNKDAPRRQRTFHGKENMAAHFGMA